MWLIAALVVLALVLGLIYRASPEANDLTYQIVKSAIKWNAWKRHNITLIGINRVMVTNKFRGFLHLNILNNHNKYKLYIRIEDGFIVIFTFCRYDTTEIKISLSHPEGIKRLGVIIDNIIYEHLTKGCNEPDYNF
jgi:hypothetical protein